MRLDRSNPNAVINAILEERELPPEVYPETIPAPGFGYDQATSSSTWSDAIPSPTMLAPDSEPTSSSVTNEANTSPDLTLDEVKNIIAGKLYLDARAIIEERYIETTQRTLTFMFSESLAHQPPLVNRMQHIGSAWLWVDVVIDAYYVVVAQVLNAATAEEVLAVAIDREALILLDPGVTIATARAIIS